MASTRENSSLRFPTRSDPNQPAQLHRLARIVKFVLAASFDMIFSMKLMTKVTLLIRLCHALAGLCICCSQTPEDRFSCVETHITEADETAWKMYVFHLG